MMDDTAYLASYPQCLRVNSPDNWNLLDGGAPFYDAYQTQDGYVSLAPPPVLLAPSVFGGCADKRGGINSIEEQGDAGEWRGLTKETMDGRRSRSGTIEHQRQLKLKV